MEKREFEKAKKHNSTSDLIYKYVYRKITLTNTQLNYLIKQSKKERESKIYG